MKNCTRFLIFVIGIIFLGSCSVSKNQKLIIGNWQYEKMGYITKDRSANPDIDTISDSQSLVDLKNRYKDAGKEQSRALRESMYKGFSFRDDKTATLFSRGKVTHGVWKMNSKGNKIVVKDSASQKYVIQIAALDTLYLKTVNAVLDGTLQRSYKKHK
jgi:hypothetical protein